MATDPRGDALLAEVRPYVLALAERLRGRSPVLLDDLRQHGLLRALELCRRPETHAHPNPPALVVQSARFAVYDLAGEARDDALALSAADWRLASLPARPDPAPPSEPEPPEFDPAELLAELCPGVERFDCEVGARHYVGGLGIRPLAAEFGVSQRRVRRALDAVKAALPAEMPEWLSECPGAPD